MREMKDSGIKWIGNIPLNWKTGKVKDVFIRKNEKANSENPTVLSLARSGVKVRDISNGEGQLAESYTNYNPVEINDLLLNPMDLYSGANCSVSKVEGVISPAYINLKVKGNNSSTYYDYYFKTQYWSMAFFAHGKGVSFDNRWTLGLETAMNYYIPIPLEKEQVKIANFLDNKISEIDSVIEKIKETIENYKKYKQSIITEAVTKGLDKNVEMKDSKIDWIGEIPKKWSIQRIKDIANLKTGTTPSTQNQEWFNGDYNWFTPGDFNENYLMNESSRKLSVQAKLDKAATIIPENTTLIIGIGGTAGKIGFVESECSCNQQITAIVSNEVYNKYIMYWMIANTKFLKETAMYTTLPIINNETLGKYLFINPNSIEEEIKIVKYLDNKCLDIDTLISRKQKIIEELEQYKKSLIYEYVTGKKEVI